MSDEDFIMTDAPRQVAIQALKDAGIIDVNTTTASSSILTNRQGQYIEIEYDLKSDVAEYETWVAVDERSEDLTELIFSAFKKLPYNCLRTPTLSDLEERVYIAPNARRAVQAKL